MAVTTTVLVPSPVHGSVLSMDSPVYQSATIRSPLICTSALHCVQKKTHTYSHFLSCLDEGCVDLNKNCSEYT